MESDFAIIDIKEGRKELESRIEDERIFVKVLAEIEKPWGDDDGIAQEYELKVHSIEEVQSIDNEWPTDVPVNRPPEGNEQ